MSFPETEQEFFDSEIREWGFDFVDAQLALGYVPTQVNGIWVWRVAECITPVNASSSTISNTQVNLIMKVE